MMNPTVAIMHRQVTFINENPVRWRNHAHGSFHFHRGYRFDLRFRIEALLVQHANAVVGIQRGLAPERPGRSRRSSARIRQIQITLKND